MDSGRWPVQQSLRAVVDVSQSEVLADIEEAGAVSLRRTIRQAVAHIEPAPAGAKFLASNDGERNGVRPIIPDLDPSPLPIEEGLVGFSPRVRGAARTRA
jgi:hypothetical protein